MRIECDFSAGTDGASDARFDECVLDRTRHRSAACGYASKLYAGELVVGPREAAGCIEQPVGKIT